MLDELDKKILYELGKNARLSYSQISKEIKSKKPIVAYHVQNLEKKGIIWKYVPVISLSRLGIYAHKIYFRFHGLDKEKKKELIEEFVKDEHINWVAESVGVWDLLISIYASNIMEFVIKKNKIFEKYGDFVQDYSIILLEDALVFNRDYLVEKSTTYRKEFVFGGKIEIEEIDDKQKKILKLIRNDGRFSLLDIAKKTKLNVGTVQSKIKDLEKRGIIQGYTTFINLGKTDLKFFKLCVHLNKYGKKEFTELLNYCKANKNVLHLIKSIGDWELEIELESDNLDYVYEFVDELKTQFPDTIKKIDLIIIKNERKLDFFPEWY